MQAIGLLYGYKEPLEIDPYDHHLSLSLWGICRLQSAASMGCWSPSDAMKAYMHTLQLCKDYYSEEEGAARSSKLVEPECMEYISALAAGNQARSMLDIESGGMSPSILALAAAARQTGGRLVCVRHEQAHLEALRRQIESLDLADVVECKRGEPLESIRQLESVDFAVVDHRLEHCRELVSAIDVNPRGSVVVVSNLFQGRRAAASYGQLVKERAVAKSVVLPFGEGMEVTRIGRTGKRGYYGGRRARRKFVVYYEDGNVAI